MNRCHHVGSSGANASVSAPLCLLQIDHRIDGRLSFKFIVRYYWFLWVGCCFSSLNHLTQLECGPSVHPTVPFALLFIT
jgi:hypothetical protein